MDFAKSHKPHFISGAIWIASFNEKGDLIVYNSSPNTFIFKGSENYLSHSVISKRNFLCFSPSGKYFALSTQGYNPYSSGAINWGHQSSTKVYIRSISNLDKEIGPYEDIGNGNITKTNKQNLDGINTNDYIIGIGYTGMMDVSTIECGLKTIEMNDVTVEAIIHPCQYTSNIKNNNKRTL